MLTRLLRIPLIAIIALILNGEFIAHGFAALAIPQLLVMYLAYSLIFDTLIARLGLNDRQLFLLGAAYGLFLEAIFNRSLYGPPQVLGLNPISVLVLAVAWGLFASVLPFWIVNRIIPRSNVSRSGAVISVVLAIAALLVLLGLLGAWWKNIGPLPNESSAGIVLVLIVVLLALIFTVARSRQEHPSVERTRVVFLTLAFYLVAGIIARAAGGEALKLGYAFLILLCGSLIYFTAWRKHRFDV